MSEAANNGQQRAVRGAPPGHEGGVVSIPIDHHQALVDREALKNTVILAIEDLRELRKQRDDLQAASNRELELRRLPAMIGQQILDKFGEDPKARGRKLLEESAEVMVEISDAWEIKQHGKERLRDEIADVMIVLLSIAHMFEVDPFEATVAKFRKVAQKYGMPGL